MAKNRFFANSSPQTPGISPSPTRPAVNHSGVVVGNSTQTALDEQEEDDICPVCDRECTCSKPAAQTPKQPTLPTPSTSSVPPILKIKLTVPQNLKSKLVSGAVPTDSQSPEETTLDDGKDDGQLPSRQEALPSAPPTPVPKKRGRPRKYPLGTEPHSHNKAGPSKLKAVSKRVNTTVKSLNLKKPIGPRVIPNKKRKRRCSTSSLSSLDSTQDEDGRSVVFPTFVSASALSSLSSRSEFSSSSDEESGFNSDSSIRHEEEQFILHDKERQARVRREREMMYSGYNSSDDSVHRLENDWIIRPPKKISHAPPFKETEADVEMGAGQNDSSSTSSVNEDDEDEDDDDDDDEDRRPLAGSPMHLSPDTEDDDDTSYHRLYKGVATGWTDASEESSFDADLFFANLSDGSSTTAEDVDENDLLSQATSADFQASFFSEQLPALIPSLLSESFNLPFEVTQGWDGQVIFTNGTSNQSTFLDAPFFPLAPMPTPSSSYEESPAPESLPDTLEEDIQMSSDDGDDEADATLSVECDDSGDTTDDDLIGPDNLPNERALKLFALPPLVSPAMSMYPSIQFPGIGSVHPLFTVSPSSSPAVRTSRPRSRFSHEPRHTRTVSPADILSKNATLSRQTPEREMKAASPKSTGPTKRVFLLPASKGHPGRKRERSGIIDDQHRILPSPYRKRVLSNKRVKSKRANLHSHGHSASYDFSSLHHLYDNEPTTPRPSSLPPSLRFPVPDANSSDASGSAITEPSMYSFTMDSMGLDEVLNPSFLTSTDMSSDNEGDTSSSHMSDLRHVKSLNRWDQISIGAFRQTREAGITSDGNMSDLSVAMKINPLNDMLWESDLASEEKKDLSPSLLPDRDGGKTPTPSKSMKLQSPFRQREGKRRAPPPPPRQPKYLNSSPNPPRPHHYARQHHPNLKTRRTSSSQRMNFASSSASAPSLNS